MALGAGPSHDLGVRLGIREVSSVSGWDRSFAEKILITKELTP